MFISLITIGQFIVSIGISIAVRGCSLQIVMRLSHKHSGPPHF